MLNPKVKNKIRTVFYAVWGMLLFFIADCFETKGNILYTGVPDSVLIHRMEYFIKSDPDSTISIALSLLREKDRGLTAETEIRIHSILSDAWFYKGNFTLSLDEAEKALAVCQSEKDSTYMSLCLNNLGAAYWQLGDLETALSTFFKALRIAETRKDTIQIADALNLIGNIYNTWEDYNKALSYYERSLHLKEKSGNLSGIGSSLNNIGLAYLGLSLYDSALVNYFRSVSIKLKNGNDRHGIGNAYNNIGDVYLEKGDFTNALKYHFLGLAYRDSVGDVRGVASSLNNIGIVYLKMGAYQTAINYFTKSLATSLPDIKMRNYKELSNTYREMGMPSKALDYYLRYSTLKDSLFDAEKFREVAAIEARYENEKKEQQLQILTQQNEIKELRLKRTRLIAIAGALLTFILMVAGLLFFWQHRLQVQKQTVELEQKLLRTQMNPHFIFNSLTAIQNFILSRNPSEAGKYLARFAKLMRLILENSRSAVISLENEIQTLENYLELQQLRFTNKFSYEITIDPDLEPDITLVPPMLTQPFIENSIEHGFAFLNDREGYLKIEIERHNGELNLMVEDNGTGRNLEKDHVQHNHRSFATEITRERLRNLSRINHTHYYFDIEDISEGTRVAFTLPYKTIS